MGVKPATPKVRKRSRFTVEVTHRADGAVASISVVDARRSKRAPEIAFCVSITTARKIARLFNWEETHAKKILEEG